MKLQQIFLKPVDRNIEGVIKADDDTSLKIEVDEYVITNEVSQRFELFLEAYTDYQGKNGSWISGFFGSGKSHLLKMLALLLENRKIDGTPVVDLFLPKCEDNKILSAALKKAVSIPSQSILFNIDQKADVISKKEIDALLAVFLKVFNESCGYYGKLGHVAQFERDLDKRGLYIEFQKAYKEIADKDWSEGREETTLEKKNISKAYAKVAGDNSGDSDDIIGSYRKDYSVSIEDFAGMINEYILSKGKDFRLNFFVDEVGQYVADNVKLMTNLQTIAESLATKCKGRSWIIVTAQEDMQNVVGEMNKQQSNDFSKIQARFDARMKLSSQNVDEVIQKRLLKKNDAGTDLLLNVYSKEVNNFKTLFDFSDGAQTYKNFRDSDHFVNSYPFIPYQFDLFQKAIENLSQHNAFEGKHSSVGERSMLGVFQEVAKKISGCDIGQLATFDLMFEGIRTTLKSQIQSAIIQAEKNLESPLAIKVLKALLLVKYVKGYNATVRNVTVLMQDSFERNLTALRKDIEEALNLLEQQTYVKRNGDLYEYLTDEEKDVEAEIKDTPLETADLITFLGDNIFDGLIREKKIRYGETGQDYSFTRRLDDKLFGKEFELGIQIITSFNSDSDNLVQLKAKNMGSSELMVVLPPDIRLVADVNMYLRTRKYISLNINTSQKDSVLKILEDKRNQNETRKQDIDRRLKDLLSKSKLLVSGNDFEIKSEDPKLRITSAFQELVKRIYPNLKMLRGVTYTEGQLKSFLTPEDSMFKGDAADLSEAEKEVLIVIRNTEKAGIRATVKMLVDKFERKPYGWNLPAILAQIAKLWGRNAIDAKEASNILTADDLETDLLNTHEYHKIYLDPTKDIDPKVLKKIKDFYNSYFDKPAAGNDQKTLGLELSGSLNERYVELELLYVQSGSFPFLKQLEEPMQRLKSHKGKLYSYYFNDFVTAVDQLIEDKHSIVDSVIAFMSGKQKEIYRNGVHLLDHEQDNLSFVDGEDAVELRKLIEDPECYRNNTMPKVKTITERLNKKIDEAREKERASALKKIETYKTKLTVTPAYEKVKKEVREDIDSTIASVIASIDSTRSIAMVRDKISTFEVKDYNNILGKINTPEPGKKDKPVVSIKSLYVKTDSTIIETEEDIDLYLAELKVVLLNEIKINKVSI